MFVDVTIGVPDPASVDARALAKEVPYGIVNVTAVEGGLEIPAERGGDAIIIANAAVIVESRRRQAGVLRNGESLLRRSRGGIYAFR